MSQLATAQSDVLVASTYRLERHRHHIDREMKWRGVEELRHPNIPISAAEQKQLEAAAMLRVAVMMTTAGMYCSKGDPPRALIETTTDEFGTVVKCLHRPPHFYDEEAVSDTDPAQVP